MKPRSARSPIGGVEKPHGNLCIVSYFALLMGETNEDDFIVVFVIISVVLRLRRESPVFSLRALLHDDSESLSK